MIDKSTVNILVVDDEPLMLVMHAGFLTNLGYTAATTCKGAVRALEVINNAVKPPDLILLDLNMPELDGVEFVRCLGNRGYSGSLIFASGEDERQGSEIHRNCHPCPVKRTVPVDPHFLGDVDPKLLPSRRQSPPSLKKTALTH